MKRKIHDLRPWPRVTRHDQTVLTVPGHVIVDYVAHEVREPKDVLFGTRPLRILDSGYRWVRVHPTSGEDTLGSALTAQLDASGAPVQLYVDIHGGEGVGEDGLPWADDLYLDVIGDWQVGDDGVGRVTEVHIIDADELDAAVREGQVSPDMQRAVWTLAREVEAALLNGTYGPLRVLRQYLTDPYT